MNSLDMINELLGRVDKKFKVKDYIKLKNEYGDQILGDTVEYYCGKICYTTDDKPVVKLNACFLGCYWEEVIPKTPPTFDDIIIGSMVNIECSEHFASVVGVEYRGAVNDTVFAEFNDGRIHEIPKVIKISKV